MKTRSILLGAILMAAIAPAFAQATSGTQSMQMGQDKQAMPVQQNDSDMKMMMNCMLPDSVPTGDDICTLIEAVAAAESGKFVKSTPRRLLGHRLTQENSP